MVPLAFQIDTFLHEVCYPFPRIWTFLQCVCAGLEHIFYSQPWLPGKSRKCWWTGNTTLFSQAVLANSCVFRYHGMIRFKDWKHSLHTWSTACCLQRACSRVDRFWFKERWSDCIAAAAAASTWLFSSSPSSWRTASDSFAVFKSVSTSCGNTLNKDMNS